MSRTPAAHLANLKIRFPEWRFSRIDASQIEPDTGEDGFLASRRDRPDVLLFAMTVGLLEALVIGWKEPESGGSHGR